MLNDTKAETRKLQLETTDLRIKNSELRLEYYDNLDQLADKQKEIEAVQKEADKWMMIMDTAKWQTEQAQMKLEEAERLKKELLGTVDGDDYLKSGILCVVDSLDCLGHDTVVGGYDDDGYIRRLGTACAHCRKCCVTGCIEECNVLTVNIYAVSTDMLSDSACLFCDDMGVTDGIQKGGFTMVNVTHYADNRWSAYQCIFRIVLFF